MSDELVVFVDYGSQGPAGFYSERIIREAEKKHIVEAFLHREFQGALSRAKVFRLFGRFIRYKNRGLFASIYKWIELEISLIGIALYLRSRKRKYPQLTLVLSLYQSFSAYSRFLHIVRRFSHVKLIIHDAVELRHSYPKFIMAPREEIISSAHELLVHGEESFRLLIHLNKPITSMPFPNFQSVVGDEQTLHPIGEPLRFLYIGHIRFEKGVDILLDAWRALPPQLYSAANLTVAGEIIGELKICLDHLTSVEVVSSFIDDDRFLKLIETADCVLFPYRGGTNSSVLTTAIGLLKPTIVSRIPLFVDSPFFNEKLSFETVEDLTKLLSKVIATPSLLVEERTRLLNRLAGVERDFTSFHQMRDVFSQRGS